VNQTVNAEINKEAVIPCRTAAYDYPTWYGQPVTTSGELTLYNHDRSSSFFQSLTNRARLSWADNNRDLVLSNVDWGDKGRYQCSLALAGKWTVQLNIIGICCVSKLI